MAGLDGSSGVLTWPRSADCGLNCIAVRRRCPKGTESDGIEYVEAGNSATIGQRQPTDINEPVSGKRRIARANPAG